MAWACNDGIGLLRMRAEIIVELQLARRNGWGGNEGEAYRAVMDQRRRYGVGRQQMKPQGIQLLEVCRRELLRGTAIIEFVERIVGALHTAVEEVAGIGSAAIVGHLGIAAVQREI